MTSRNCFGFLEKKCVNCPSEDIVILKFKSMLNMILEQTMISSDSSGALYAFVQINAQGVFYADYSFEKSHDCFAIARSW